MKSHSPTAQGWAGNKSGDRAAGLMGPWTCRVSDVHAQAPALPQSCRPQPALLLLCLRFPTRQVGLVPCLADGTVKWVGVE